MFDATLNPEKAVTFATAEDACDYARAHGVPQNFSLYFTPAGRFGLRRPSGLPNHRNSYICKMDPTASTKAEER